MIYIDNMDDNLNIYLIGFRCTGKTTLGQMIAQKLGRPFVDLDDVVTDRAEKTVEALVASSGWEKFRRLEKEALLKVTRQKGIVVATGGGIILDPDNISVLRETGRVIWLIASPEEIKKRIEADSNNLAQRPSLTGKNIIDEVTTVLKARNPLYRAAAHQVVDTDGVGIDQLIELIINSRS